MSEHTADLIAALEACAEALDRVVAIRQTELSIVPPMRPNAEFKAIVKSAWHNAIAAVERLEGVSDE